MVKIRKSRLKKKSNSFSFVDIKEFFALKKNATKSYCRNKYKKIKDYIGENYYDELNAIKKFMIKIFGYGLIINIPAFTFFGFSFNLFTLFSFGIIWYFIEDEFITIFRRLIAKR